MTVSDLRARFARAVGYWEPALIVGAVFVAALGVLAVAAKVSTKPAPAPTVTHTEMQPTVPGSCQVAMDAAGQLLGNTAEAKRDPTGVWVRYRMAAEMCEEWQR